MVSEYHTMRSLNLGGGWGGGGGGVVGGVWGGCGGGGGGGVVFEEGFLITLRQYPYTPRGNLKGTYPRSEKKKDRQDLPCTSYRSIMGGTPFPGRKTTKKCVLLHAHERKAPDTKKMQVLTEQGDKICQKRTHGLW